MIFDELNALKLDIASKSIETYDDSLILAFKWDIKFGGLPYSLHLFRKRNVFPTLVCLQKLYYILISFI